MIIVPMSPQAVLSAEVTTAVSFPFVIDPLNSHEAHQILTVVTETLSCVFDSNLFAGFPNMTKVHDSGVQFVVVFVVSPDG